MGQLPLRPIHQNTGIVLNIPIAIAMPIMPIGAVRAVVGVKVGGAMPIRKPICRHVRMFDL